MGDYGPTSTTNNNAFESFNSDIFKDTKTQQDLNESKDSDEGFSSSFSPTSESSMIQEQQIATTLHLWGNNTEKEEPYFMTQMAPVNSINAPFQPTNARRVIQAPSPVGQVRKPTPALSSYLASNKVIANSLGVSGWATQSPQTQVSSWPSNQPTPIGSNHVNVNHANWNGALRNGSANIPLSVQVSNASIAFQQQQQHHQQQHHQQQHHHQKQHLVGQTRSAVLSHHQNHNNSLYHQQQQSAIASVQAKNLKNRSFGSPLPYNTTSGNAVPQHSLSNISSGLDMTMVDDITHLTNNFSNLATSSDQNGNHNNAVNGFFSNQERRNDDGVKYSSLESRFLGDVFKSALDSDNIASYDAFRAYNNIQKKGFPRVREDQIVPSLSSSINGSPRSDMDLGERFSRKVFVGGLPPDIDEDEIHASFCRFGPLTVDWPHKAESKSYFPPKGYAFLLYKDEISVQRLIDCCIMQDGKLYLCVSSPTIKDKPVQIRPWNLADADFVMDGSQPLDPRKTIFVGGVPRPLRAVELAMIMDRLYGGVCYSGIDVDPELKYPKGAGRVAFSNQQSYIAAISARFIQLQHGEIDKRVEVKPYVLDDQMCDECHGVRCNGKFAPFFCSNITCLQYYCEQCWAIIHSRPGREFHKPLVKEGGDRPRQNTLGFRWPLKTQQIPSIPSIPLLQ